MARARYELGGRLLLADRDHRRGRAAVDRLGPGRGHVARRATGCIWWQHDFPIATGLTIGTPVRSGRYLLITEVENAGLMLALNPDRPAARVVWTGTNPNRTDRPVQRSMTSTPIVLGDAIYGINSHGELRGVDATTGERLWPSDRLVHEDRWASSHLVQHQNRWRNVDRAVLWAHPAFANGHVIARNAAEVVRMSLTAADYE